MGECIYYIHEDKGEQQECNYSNKSERSNTRRRRNWREKREVQRKETIGPENPQTGEVALSERDH